MDKPLFDKISESDETTLNSLLNTRLPRYTSYPTAPMFSADQANKPLSWLSEGLNGEAISLYIHVPFCEALCWFCGCNTNVTSRYAPVAHFVETFLTELDLVVAQVGKGQPVKHIHFGGGSPTILSADDFRRIMAAIKSNFSLIDHAEIAVEMDPRTLSPEKIKAYADEGVNRASLGIQDFDETVQKAIHRVQSTDLIVQTIQDLKANGISAINMDLIYGLPYQSVESVAETVRQTLALGPDRIALFSYAHVPWMKKHQQMIAEDALPDADTRLQMHLDMGHLFETHGYQAIGMDHFAKKDDSLSIAARQGALHRNFQGYTVDSAHWLIGLGPSAISRTPRGYYQNATHVKDWRNLIEGDKLPIEKAYGFSQDDPFFAAIIERIMCDFKVNLNSLCLQYDRSIDDCKTAIDRLATFIGAGIVTLDHGQLSVQTSYKMAVRSVAACFDQYLENGPGKFSKVA